MKAWLLLGPPGRESRTLFRQPLHPKNRRKSVGKDPETNGCGRRWEHRDDGEGGQECEEGPGRTEQRGEEHLGRRKEDRGEDRQHREDQGRTAKWKDKGMGEDGGMRQEPGNDRCSLGDEGTRSRNGPHSAFCRAELGG